MDETIKIMIVDDDPDDRSLAIRELRRNFQDIEIIEVVEPDDLSEALEEMDFDIVITDYHVRWTNGLKVLKEVKKRKPDCPVIMFTGTGNEELAVQAMKSGLEDYVVKSPKHFVRLSASVYSAVQDIKKRREKKELENLYTRLFQRVPVALYSVDPDGNILAANSAMIDLLGFGSEEEICSYEAADFHPDEEKRKEELFILKEAGVVKGYELRLKRKDGKSIWVKDNAYVIRDEQGEIQYIEGSLEDITAVKEAHMDLKTQKEKIEKLHDVASKIVECDTEEEVYNLGIDAAENILGFSACTIHKVEDDEFVVMATKEGALEIGGRNPVTGIAGKSYKENRSILVRDLEKEADAEPAKKEYQSAISIPMEDVGVFLNISTEKNKFDEDDIEMGEILVSHMTDALKRIEFTKNMSENIEKLRQLHLAVSKIDKVDNEYELFDMTLEMANNILDFEWCTIHMIEGDEVVVRATTHTETEMGTRLSINDGIYGKTCREKRAFLVNDITQDEDAKPTASGLESAISVPIGEYGDIQILSNRKNRFNEEDLKLAELLANHVSEALKRIKYTNKLQESEEKYRLISENSYDLICILDYDGGINYANRAFDRLLGYEPDQLVGTNVYDLVAPEHKEEIGKAFVEIIEKGEEQERLQFKIKDTDANLLWFEAVGRKMEGTEESVMMVARDINKRKRAVVKAELSGKKIQKLHDVALTMMACSDADEVYELTIEAASDILDFNVCTIAVEDDSHLSIKTAQGEVYEPDLKIKKDVGILGKTYTEKRSFLVDDIDESNLAQPYKTKYKSALSIPMGKFGVFQAISFKKADFDEDDLKMAEVLVSHTVEVLKRIQYEKKIREEEERYRSIFENTGTAMILLDQDMKIFMANKEGEKLLGYPAQELNDMNFDEFVLEEDSERMEKLMEDILEDKEKGIPSDTFLKIQNRYGDIREIFQTISHLPDSNFVLLSMIDITQQKKNLDTLEESQEMFRVAFEGAPLGMLLIDNEKKIIEVNQLVLDMTGYSEKDLASMTLDDVLGEDERWREDFDDLVNGKKEQFYRHLPLKKKDSTSLGCGVKCLAVKKHDGEIKRIVMYLQKEHDGV